VRKKNEPKVVIDASALLAFLHRERGYERVRPVLHASAISAVNLEEVLVKMSRRQVDPQELWREVHRRGVRAVPYGEEDALLGAGLDAQIAKKGSLSLGDRACLSLALRLRLPVLTADRLWQELKLEIEVRPIR
jgi:ribonuclease VapC